MPKVISMDLTRCTFCRACEVACEREHGGHSNMFVQLIDETRSIPVNCRQCQDGPCVQVCPTHALHRETPDAVTITSIKCIGCSLCTLACPVGAVWLDVPNKVARKCDLCLHRIQRGLEPACVATCSARALTFGEMEESVARARTRQVHAIISRAVGAVGPVVIVPPNWHHPTIADK